MLDKRVTCPDCGGNGIRGFSLTPWIEDGRLCFMCKGTGYVLESERNKYIKERIDKSPICESKS